MNIEIDPWNREEAIRKAKLALEWEERQCQIVEDMASPIHALYGINTMLYARASKARGILNALKSGYKLSLTEEEARSIRLI